MYFRVLLILASILHFHYKHMLSLVGMLIFIKLIPSLKVHIVHGLLMVDHTV